MPRRIEYPPEFEALWESYPARKGGNPKKLAFKAYQARLKEGVTHAELVDAVRRYRRYCDSHGTTGTQYVMMTRTFLGPNERWADEYEEADDGKWWRALLA